MMLDNKGCDGTVDDLIERERGTEYMIIFHFEVTHPTPISHHPTPHSTAERNKAR